MISEQLKKAVAEFCKDRDEVLRSLDVEKFNQFWKKHKLRTPPKGWADPALVPLIMMHKARLQVETMTKEEKEISQSWLLSHGYTLDYWSNHGDQ